MEQPNSARIRLVERRGSDKVTKAEKSQEPVHSKLQPRKNVRQPSIGDDDSSSSSEEITKSTDSGDKEKEKRRENKEINNFISLLDTTLRMNKPEDKSDDENDDIQSRLNGQSSSPPAPVLEPEPIHKSSSMPSVETLTSTTRLMGRIKLLHKDCVAGVGYEAMKKAYEILDRIEDDEVEPRLVELLGKEKFDEYAGKLWQLKFCEESLFT